MPSPLPSSGKKQKVIPLTSCAAMVSFVTSLTFVFLICEMGLMMVPSPPGRVVGVK